MAKGKKRGSKIRDVLHLVDRNVEENRMDPNQEEVDERTLRARKRLSNSNILSHQLESQHKQMDNVQIQQQAPTGLKQTPIYETNMGAQSQANRFENNLPVQQVQTAQIVDGAQTQPASWSHVAHCSYHRVQSAGLESPQQNSSDESQSETINKKGRGPAQFPAEWDNGNRLRVTLNARGQMVGLDYQKLATVIGCLAKVGTNFPITKNWPEVDERYKELAWQEIEQKTFLPIEAKPIVYEMISSSWREWKHRIKVHFKKFEHNDDNDKEMIEKLDNRVIVSQFREAIHNWRKPEVQERALTNAINRGQRKFPHRTGRTAFSEVVDEVPDATSTGRQVQVAPAPSIRKDGRKVELLGDDIPKQVVAEGIVISEDPRAKVANMPLGPNHWKIYIENAISPTYILSGSVEDGDDFTVGQAINTILAWPKVNVLEK